MKNRAVKIGIVASILPHLFCCGLPIALAIIGLFAPEFAHASIIPHWLEPWLFVFSGAMLILSWVLITHECKCSCDCCGSARHHRRQKIIMSIITAIFIVSIILHLISHSH